MNSFRITGVIRENLVFTLVELMDKLRTVDHSESSVARTDKVKKKCYNNATD